ncbi:hypothetical protein H8R18_02675 [Nanchangia anserum]|uniref:hypothetical protein n=1 Tax=Nanchangia anserum TaxID=2692125 RepID=UPI0018841A59|nr:hypothetical protein [Nanchangia anserum]QOX82262.1 hypothetical protein H8R18_02675 [Nanchangia anserum]
MTASRRSRKPRGTRPTTKLASTTPRRGTAPSPHLPRGQSEEREEQVDDQSSAECTIPAPPPLSAHTPSRKQMREARKRGQATIEIDGVKYPTGLIPVVRDQVLAVSDSEEGADIDEFGGDSVFGEEPRS